jgi:MATE family, multidrug efflux pump
MTSSADIKVPSLARTPTSAIGRELADTIRLAAPMALTQLGQIAMMTTDIVLIGRLGEAAIAAAALAHTVTFMTFTCGMGLVSAVAPLASQAFGAGNASLVRRTVRVGLWAALLVSLPLILIPLFGDRLLLALGQPTETARLAQRYLQGLAWGIAPALWTLAIRGFMGAVKRPAPGLWITLAAIPANAALVYLLAYGVGPIPPLELFGVGLATTMVNFGMFVAGVWVAHFLPPFRKYRILGHLWRIDWTLMRQLFLIGAPISVALLLEYGLFAAAALLMGLIDTRALAAHQIALQVTAILFMVPFGISMAATVRVGHAVGRNEPAAIRRAGFVAMLLGVALVSALTLVVVSARFAIARFFLGEVAESAAGVVDLAATLLVVGATFFVADAVQTIAAGALRGMNDTRVPLLFAAISYWLIGFAASYGLAFWAEMGAVGVWVGLSLGTLLYAILLIMRFRLLAARLPSVLAQTDIE